MALSKTALHYRNNPKSRERHREYQRELNKKPDQKKYRAELNSYNRKKGTYGNGDSKDASHKRGKIIGFEKASTNRGRSEKSRLVGSKRK